MPPTRPWPIIGVSTPCSRREASPPLWGVARPSPLPLLPLWSPITSEEEGKEGGDRRGEKGGGWGGKEGKRRRGKADGEEEKGDREDRVEEGGGEGQTVVPRSGAEGDGRWAGKGRQCRVAVRQRWWRGRKGIDWITKNTRLSGKNKIQNICS